MTGPHFNDLKMGLKRDAPDAADVLRAQGLARSYAGRPALRGVSLEVSPGEIVALLGPNGAGKSTLLQILAGVIRADAGTAQVADVLIPGQERKLAKRVGFVPQGESVYPELTVEENLRFFAALHGLRGEKLTARVRQLMKEAHVADRAATPTTDLSGGLRQRVAVAASLVHDPEVLLLDEPGTGLDPVARDRLSDIMRTAKSRGRVVLFSTHSFDEARRVADRVVLLGNGEVVSTGPATDVAAWEARFRQLEGA